MNHPLSEHFHAIFSQQTTHFFMFLGAWLHKSSVVCRVVFLTLGCLIISTFSLNGHTVLDIDDGDLLKCIFFGKSRVTKKIYNCFFF